MIPATAPQVQTRTGSSWDLDPGEAFNLGRDWEGPTHPRHLAEWIEGSAVHPALAGANLQSLAGSAVIEAIAGDRLEQLGAHGQQYATGQVGRLLGHLDPVAAGGWWCSGLDPLADWAPMDWGCFKPDAPRSQGKAIKYEHPALNDARSFWLRVPAGVAQLVADRHLLQLPAEVAADHDGSAGAFWRWWAQTIALPLVVTEGAKKAAAILSAGVPAVALPGICNGCPRSGPKDPKTGKRTGPAMLLADLAAVPLAGRPCWVLFDHSHSDKGRRDVARAGRQLGRLLAKVGADVMFGTVPAGPCKGADDWLAAGRSWDDLAAALQPLAPLPVLPRLRPAAIVAPAGCYLGAVAPIPAPSEARLVALAAPMGSGKTEAVAAAIAPMLFDGERVVQVNHRVSLGESQAERLGVPWGADALPGSDLRQQGIALCVDSLVGRSAIRFNPADWAGCVVVIDEICQFMQHVLFSTGTAIANRRPEVLANLSQLLAGASQVIVADAQLSESVLTSLEAAAGAAALLIGSEHRPAEGRQLVVHPSRASWRRELLEQLRQRRRLWIATTAQQAGSKNSAQTLQRLARKHWPEARILLVDSETVADPTHDAHRLAANPDGIAGAYDVVVASPAVAAGLSVTLRGHFDAVMVAAGGTTDPEGVAQAAARVRDDCPRHLYAPERSPGHALRVGSGSFDPQELLTHQAQHGAAIVAQLAGTVDLETGSIGPWLRLWAELAADSNRKDLAYGATVRGLLEREGYEVIYAGDLSPEAEVEAQRIDEELEEITTAGQEAEDAAVMAAELLTDAQAAELMRRRRRTPVQRAQLARWRIASAWGLGASAPSAELLDAHRKQHSERSRFGWALQSIEARQLVAAHDQATAQKLAPRGVGWAPDLCRELIGPKLTAADALGLRDWLRRSDWFTADDQQLAQLQATATACRSSLTQVLGVSPGQTATGTLRRLLRLAGYRLETKRTRESGERAYRYRVVPEALPAGVIPEQLEAAWMAQLSRNIPYMNRGAR